jgi:hypothetical protein
MVNPDGDQPATLPGAIKNGVVVACRIVSFSATGIGQDFRSGLWAGFQKDLEEQIVYPD